MNVVDSWCALKSIRNESSRISSPYWVGRAERLAVQEYSELSDVGVPVPSRHPATVGATPPDVGQLPASRTDEERAASEDRMFGSKCDQSSHEREHLFGSRSAESQSNQEISLSWQ